MKKILMTLFVAAMAMTVNAQVYLGGSVGVGSVKFGHNDAETTYKFMPEIGYNLNSDWAIGVVLGYQKGACKLGNGNYGQDVDTELLQISPYVRYTVFKSNLINAFVGFDLMIFDGRKTLENLGVVGEKMTHRSESPHNASVSLNCCWRTQDATEHGNAVFCESVR